MNILSKDARGFVDRVALFVSKEQKTKRIDPKIQRLLHSVTSEAVREQKAIVETAVSLAPDQIADIQFVLDRLIGHPVIIHTVIRPDILGGVRIQIADWVVDTSLSAKVAQLASTLVR